MYEKLSFAEKIAIRLELLLGSFCTAQIIPICPDSWKLIELFQCFLYLIQIFDPDCTSNYICKTLVKWLNPRTAPCDLTWKQSKIAIGFFWCHFVNVNYWPNVCPVFFVYRWVKKISNYKMQFKIRSFNKFSSLQICHGGTGSESSENWYLENI